MDCGNSILPLVCIKWEIDVSLAIPPAMVRKKFVFEVEYWIQGKTFECDLIAGSKFSVADLFKEFRLSKMLPNITVSVKKIQFDVESKSH